ncbi:MAG: hypothetical protein FWH29_03135 [Methanobrevibacter sp.]|nr:hypothetical protein [Methanobrevibacter sp.]
MKLSFCNNIFSIVTINKDLENEIAEKLEYEGRKKYPSLCTQFPERIGIEDFP